jgi:nucleoside-diphosphate-sugar epimerase
MKTVFVTGGTGFIGRHVVQALAGLRTCKIVVLSRSDHGDSGNVSYRRGELGDARGLEEAIAGADAVVHLAGCKRNLRDLTATNVLGTRNIVSACEKASVQRLIYLSSVGVVGQASERDISEKTPCRPANEYEKSKYDAEVLVKQWSARRPGTTTILRPTNVFGEHDPEHHLLNLITKLKTHRFFFVGRDMSGYYLNYLYVRELSALVATLLTSAHASDLFIVNTPTPLSDFITTIKRLLNDHRPIRHLPYWPVRAMAVCGDHLPRAWVPSPPITSLKLAELTNRRQYSAALLAREVGWSPAFSLEEALRNLLTHYREAGLLK